MDRAVWAAPEGSLLIFTVHREGPPVLADLAVLDGDRVGEEHRGIEVMPKLLQRQLRASVGVKLLGRLGRGHAKPGQAAPWTLRAATEADKAAGRAWLDRKHD